jgi:DMSO/TMAO reductase YedYZ heme-binding membrane subunit
LAWYLTGASLVWGVVLSTRLVRRTNLPGWLLGLHRSLSVTAAALMLVHVVAALGHHRAAIGVADLFVPGHSHWRAGAVTWGVVALYLSIAITVTSAIIDRMPRRWWHFSHLLAYPMFVASAVHAYGAGTDSQRRFFLWTGLALVEAALGLGLFRVWAHIATRRQRRAARAAQARQAGLAPSAQ